MTKVVCLEDLVVEYRQKKKRELILDHINLSADEKEIIAIMGPSGSGKSILLKTIAGIVHPAEGNRMLFGEECTKQVPKHIKRKIGLIFQDHNLLDWRTVEGNLRVPFEIFGIKDEDFINKQIEKALDMVGLLQYRGVLPHELSGGMMQRVGIARAMAFEPDLLLMDQPFGALDAITRSQIRFDFLHIFEKANKTIIIVTNSIDEALLFSNRILVLSNAPGKISETIQVKIPFSERKTEVAYDDKFTDLRREMIEIISRQYKKEQIESEVLESI